MHRIAFKRCPHCDSSDVYVSDPKTVREQVAIFLLLRLVRCHDCMRRFYRPLFVETPLFSRRIIERKKPPEQGHASPEDEHRSA